MNRCSIPGGGKKLLYYPQRPDQHGTASLSSDQKRPGCEAHHSSLPKAEVKSKRGYTSTSTYAFMERCSIR